ncbi:winged helix-turn-helix domain-containing protein [Halonotius pteroides]|nr:helix-turn-helix domain-containing protein [Halonotius pteroides]
MVQDAIERFDIDGEIIDTLRHIAAAPSETRTISDLESEFGVQRDTIHNRLHHLREYDLVSDTLSSDDDSIVSLISAGRSYLDAVRASVGLQSSLDDSLIAVGKSSNNSRVKPACSRDTSSPPPSPSSRPRNRLPCLHNIRELPRHRFHAITATVSNADISVVDTDVDLLDDRAAPGRHYDHDNRQLIVSAEYDNPLNYWVSIARALSNRDIWSWILTDDKLDAANRDKFRDLFADHRVVLRQLRCLGYLPDRITDINDFRDLILDALDKLLDDTKRLTNGNYPDALNESEFRGDIVRDAHGLAGTMAHILDIVDVEIIREVRVPRYREFSGIKKQGLIKTIGKGSAIQSVYGEANTYRHLYEDRENKREQAIVPDVDAHDPYAELIGSFAVVGDFKSQTKDFVRSLNNNLEPGKPHDDAPEFQLNLSIRGDVSRSEYAQTATRLCREKNINPTPQAVSTLAGLCNSPFEVAEALNHLQSNEDRRSIDAREVRYALSQLGADDILRGTNSTPRKAVIALLNATEPLSQSELADRADVSERSLRDHLPDLLDLGLIDETPTGYRFNLSFNTGEERTNDRYPMYVVDPDLRPDIHKAAKALKTAHEHHFGTPIPDDDFPSSPTGRDWCADLRGIEAADTWIRSVLPLLWGLETREEYRDDPDLDPLIDGDDTTDIRLGPDIPQQRLAAYSVSKASG